MLGIQPANAAEPDRSTARRSWVVATVLGFGGLSVWRLFRLCRVTRRDEHNLEGASPPDRNNAATILRLIKERFYSFTTVLGIGLLLLVSLILNCWIAAMGIAVPQAGIFVISYLLTAILFATLYRIVPDIALKWSDVTLGAIITSLLFMLGNQLMGVYFARADFGSTYGAAGAPIVVLLWVYYSAQIIFWGAEFTKVYATTLGSHRSQQD